MTTFSCPAPTNRTSFSTIFSVVAGLLISASTALAGAFSDVIVFGDSLSDTGTSLFYTNAIPGITARSTPPAYANRALDQRGHDSVQQPQPDALCAEQHLALGNGRCFGRDARTE